MQYIITTLDGGKQIQATEGMEKLVVKGDTTTVSVIYDELVHALRDAVNLASYRISSSRSSSKRITVEDPDYPGQVLIIRFVYGAKHWQQGKYNIYEYEYWKKNHQ